MSNFRDTEELGRGGFGVVCKCVRQSDGAVFARKTLLLNDPGSVKRFQREVRLIQKLTHRGIIKVISTHLQSEPHWYVMPHYPGSLLQVMPQLHIDRDRGFRIFEKVLEAIGYAHKQGVIHRDLKPENILLDTDDSAVVTDFGLGRALDALTSRATGTGAWIGTFGYMAPEQMNHAAHADARSDIFALGRMLYEMMTCEPRWAVQDLTKLPVGISEIVQKCTLTEPDQRFQTVAEMRKALARITSQHPQAEQSLDKLVQRIVDQSLFTSGDIEELAKLIGLCRDQSELLHEVAIKISVPAFTALDRSFPEISKLLARRFAERSMGQGWSFSYTDTLGSTCAKLHGATLQPEIKGLMAATALEVGASHNRFYVLDVAASLIAGAKDETEALAVAHAICQQKGNFAAIQGRLTVWKLHPALGEVFADQTA
jgi:serine/threonine protein kinase